MAAMQDESKIQIKVRNRDLRMMAADTWHQSDSIDQKRQQLDNIGEESNKTFGEKTTNEQYHQCLQNDTEVSIHMLNDDCLNHIFLFLPISDRVRIERVCKRWKDLSQDSWRMVKTLDLSPSTWGYLERTCGRIRTSVLHKILVKCGKFLTQLDLSDKSGFMLHTTFTIVGKYCPNITSIDVTGLRIYSSDINILASNCKNLTRFSLGPSVDSCDNELKYLFNQNKNLEYLAISETDIAGKSFLCLPTQTMQTIILDRCYDIQDKHISTALMKQENLKRLAINTGISVLTLQAIGEHCKSLNELEIEGALLFAETVDMLRLTKLVNLKVLTFTFNPLVSDEFLINLAQQCQQLVYLDITGFRNVTDIGLVAIATLPKLEKLTINYVKNITDKGLENMCGLKELKCRKCTKISDQGMSMFIRSSPHLQLLDISGCCNITNLTVDAAKDACNTRSNNLMLKMIIGNTAIFPKEQDKEQTSPLLQIINVDLCDDDFNIFDEYMYSDNESWFDEDSDCYNYESEDSDYCCRYDSEEDSSSDSICF